MKCRKCGAEFDKGQFCPECGTKVQQDKVGEYQSNTVNYAQKEKSQEKNTMSIVSLIAGVLSVVTLGCWIIPEIVAIVCGVNSNKREKTKAATAGIICGIIGTVIFSLVIIYAISVNISNGPSDTEHKPTEAIVTTEDTVETTTTEEPTTEEAVTTEEKEESKDKNNLTQYYGKSISELQESTGIEMQKDGDAYYTGTLFLNTDNNDKIISMSMTYYYDNEPVENELNIEGIVTNDSILDAANKLEAAGYKFKKDDKDTKIYIDENNMIVTLSNISQNDMEMLYVEYMTEEVYTNQQNESNNYDKYGIGDTISTNIINAEIVELTDGIYRLDVECEITNISNETIKFNTNDYFSLNINGIIIDNSGSDYDLTEITSGTQFKTTVRFPLPDNCTTDINDMIMTADGVEFNLAK